MPLAPAHDVPAGLESAHEDALAYCAYLNAHGYDADTWFYRTVLADADPACGYAVEYAGSLVRPDGSRAAFTSGITILCEDGRLSWRTLTGAGRALITLGTSGGHALMPYYVAGWNPRDTPLRRDQSVNPGTLPQVVMHKMSAHVFGDGPAVFYDLRMTRVTLDGHPVMA